MKGRNSSFCLVGKEGPSSEENIKTKKSTTKISLPHRLFLMFKKTTFTIHKDPTAASVLI